MLLLSEGKGTERDGKEKTKGRGKEATKQENKGKRRKGKDRDAGKDQERKRTKGNEPDINGKERSGKERAGKQGRKGTETTHNSAFKKVSLSELKKGSSSPMPLVEQFFEFLAFRFPKNAL